MNDLFDAPARPPAPTTEAPPPIGHNSPPAPLPYDPEVVEACGRIVTDFCDAAGAWADLVEIESDEQSQKLTDFVSGARKVKKKVDDARVAAKKPHDDAAKAVQEVFSTLLLKLDRAIAFAKPLQEAWLRKKMREEEERKRRDREEAERQREEAAAAAARAAAANDASGMVEAEKAQKDAEKLAKQAEKPAKVGAASATGGGRTMALREVRTSEMHSLGLVFAFFKERPELRDVLQRLANAHVRAADWDGVDIPGTTTKREEKVA
jgi:hypothetical protein